MWHLIQWILIERATLRRQRVITASRPGGSGGTSTLFDAPSTTREMLSQHMGIEGTAIGLVDFSLESPRCPDSTARGLRSFTIICISGLQVVDQRHRHRLIAAFVPDPPPGHYLGLFMAGSPCLDCRMPRAGTVAPLQAFPSRTHLFSRL